MGKNLGDGPPIIISKGDISKSEKAVYEPIGKPIGSTYEGPKRNSGMAIAGMCAGIVGVSLCWIPILAQILGVIAIVFGAIAIPETGKPGVGGRGMAIAGLVTGVVAVSFLLVMWAVGWSILGWALF